MDLPAMQPQRLMHLSDLHFGAHYPQVCAAVQRQRAAGLRAIWAMHSRCKQYGITDFSLRLVNSAENTPAPTIVQPGW